MKPCTVAIVGSNNLFREGLQGLLKRSKFAVVLNADSFDDPRLGQPSNQADLLVLVVSGMAEPAALIDQVRSSHDDACRMKIVLLSDPLTTEQLREAAMAGAQAVVSKEITAEVLHRVLELVMLGQQLFPGQRDGPPPRSSPTSLVPFARPLTLPAPAAGGDRPAGRGSATAVVRTIFTEESGLSRALSLSERERQILLCLMDGASNKTIARHLSITEATVKVHIKGLLRKIRVTNRTQAAVWGLNNAEVFGSSEPPSPRTDQAPERLAICQVAS